MSVPDLGLYTRMLMTILDFGLYANMLMSRTGFWFASEHAHEHTAYMPFKFKVENLN